MQTRLDALIKAQAKGSAKVSKSWLLLKKFHWHVNSQFKMTEQLHAIRTTTLLWLTKPTIHFISSQMNGSWELATNFIWFMKSNAIMSCVQQQNLIGLPSNIVKAENDKQRHQTESCKAWFADSEDVGNHHECAPRCILATVLTKLNWVTKNARKKKFGTLWQAAWMHQETRKGTAHEIQWLKLVKPCHFVNHCLAWLTVNTFHFKFVICWQSFLTRPEIEFHECEFSHAWSPAMSWLNHSIVSLR